MNVKPIYYNRIIRPIVVTSCCQGSPSPKSHKANPHSEARRADRGGGVLGEEAASASSLLPPTSNGIWGSAVCLSCQIRP